MFLFQPVRLFYRPAVLEDMLHDWIDSLRKINQTVPPSLAIEKAKQLAKELNISEDEFKASWEWFSHFKLLKREWFLNNDSSLKKRNN